MISLTIEATSRCVLACSRCERTILNDKFGKKFPVNDLNISDITKFLDTDINEITLCGNLGDPIYHKNFIELVYVLKQKSRKIKITTNGSYKTKEWWENLNRLLSYDDTIMFSIDGIPNNFTQYRVNADWNSIEVGIKECVKGKVKTIWKFIPFRYNEYDIEDAKKISENLGIDVFRVTPSDRWNFDDPLKPTQKSYNGPRDIVQQEYKQFKNTDFEIKPRCSDNTKHYVSASGFYVPCCYSKHHSFYYKNKWWKNRVNHNIKHTTLSKQVKIFNEFYDTIQNDRPEYCVFNCGIKK